MRLSRINLAMLVASSFGFNRSLNILAGSARELSQVMQSTAPQTQSIKPNRVSQAKRRKYARQGRK